MFGQFNTEDYGRDKEEQTIANREPETILKKENKQDVSTIWGSVPTVPEKFENAALFLRLCLPVHTYPSRENGAFRKRPSNRSNLKTQAFRFLVTENVSSFSKTMASRQLYDFSDRVFFKHKSKMTEVVWMKNVSCVFRAKPSFSFENEFYLR